MQFNSYLFILVFLPLCVLGYFVCGRFSEKARVPFLIAASLLFYSRGGAGFLPYLAAAGAATYILALLIQKTKYGKVFLAAGIVMHVGILFYYKYTGFFLWNVNSLFHTDFAIPSLALPLGISFLSFQQISFLADLYHGEIRDLSLWNYILYIFYFPKVISGPITPWNDLVPQFHDKKKLRPDPENLYQGFAMFCLGLGKKVLLADQLSGIADAAIASFESLGGMDVLLCALAYTFQIYFDFSGYSDMALGVSRMLNIELPINFDSPYKSLSIRDFWKRWHISLTKFLTKYIYIPLGGSRKGKARTYLNTMIVFLVSGIWHGASYTFIAWGILHGLLSVWDRIFHKAGEKIPKALCWAVNFLAVSFLWLLFRADGLHEYMSMMRTLVLHPSLVPGEAILGAVSQIPIISALPGTLGLVLLLAFCFVLCLVPENNERRKWNPAGGLSLACSLIAVISLFFLGRVSTFLYFNF